MQLCSYVHQRRNVGSGSWSCKNAFAGRLVEARTVWSQAAIATISALVPTMFMTRVRL